MQLERNCRSGRRILDAAPAVAARAPHRRQRRPRALLARRSERAQAQAVAAEAEQLIAGGVPPERIAVLVAP